jgi:hypothetical protein
VLAQYLHTYRHCSIAPNFDVAPLTLPHPRFHKSPWTIVDPSVVIPSPRLQASQPHTPNISAIPSHTISPYFCYSYNLDLRLLNLHSYFVRVRDVASRILTSGAVGTSHVHRRSFACILRASTKISIKPQHTHPVSTLKQATHRAALTPRFRVLNHLFSPVFFEGLHTMSVLRKLSWSFHIGVDRQIAKSLHSSHENLLKISARLSIFATRRD